MLINSLQKKRSYLRSPLGLLYMSYSLPKVKVIKIVIINKNSLVNQMKFNHPINHILDNEHLLKNKNKNYNPFWKIILIKIEIFFHLFQILILNFRFPILI